MDKENKLGQMLNALTGLKMRFPKGLSYAQLKEELDKLGIFFNRAMCTKFVKSNVLNKFGNARYTKYTINEFIAVPLRDALNSRKPVVEYTFKPKKLRPMSQTNPTEPIDTHITTYIKYLEKLGYVVFKPIENASVSITQTIQSHN